jgi:hypothetical protein
MRSAVVGQTGRVVLSSCIIQYKRSQERTIHYRYTKLQQGWHAWVCKPFHSRTYGVCGFGANKARAKTALENILANDYGYIGKLVLMD